MLSLVTNSLRRHPLALVLLVMVGVFVFYYRDSQRRLTTQSGDLADRDAVIEQQATRIQTLAAVQEANQQLHLDLAAAHTESNELRRLLAEHDLEYLAREKPGLIENIA